MCVFFTAEIGLNHNGDIEIAKQLIRGAKDAGCDAVKFQKRTVDLVYSADFLEAARDSPWGSTQRAQKEGLEFGQEEYGEVDSFCRKLGIEWFASAWDLEAQRFLKQFRLRHNKVASALLTDMALMGEIADEGLPTFISTGMSTIEEIDTAVSLFREKRCPFELMHCVSVYAMKNAMANLRVIHSLKERYSCNVGYSGHETGRTVSVAAAAMGATSLERHITLDRTMYGSDQAASLGLRDLQRLMDDIRTVVSCFGDGVKCLIEAEKPTREKLRCNRPVRCA
jgi:N-acetylneuraminate synthase